MPRNIRLRLFRELHKSLLFAVLTPPGGPLEVGRRELRGLIKPAGQNGSPAKAARFSGQDDEDGLGDLPGFVRVAEPAQRRRIDQVHVPPDQCGKRRLRTVRGKVPHQIHVIGVHLPHYVRRDGKSGHQFSAGRPGLQPSKNIIGRRKAPRRRRWLSARPWAAGVEVFRPPANVRDRICRMNPATENRPRFHSLSLRCCTAASYC